MCRIVIPRFLPALSRGVLGELRPHTEDSADWVQRPQTDTDAQGGVLFHFRIPNSNSVMKLSAASTVSPTFLPTILQGADGVECLIVAVDASTLMDFLENEEGDWEEKALDL